MKVLIRLLIVTALPMFALARMSTHPEAVASLISIQANALQWRELRIGMPRSEIEKLLRKPLKPNGGSTGIFSSRTKYKNETVDLSFGGKNEDSKLIRAHIILAVSCEISGFKALKELIQGRTQLELVKNDRCLATYQLGLPEHQSQWIVLKSDGIWLGYANTSNDGTVPN